MSKSGGKLYVAFIDFKTAFDSIKRSKLWSVLGKLGVNGKLLNAIKGLYSSVTSRVRSNGVFSECFDCPIGLKQGCMASPKLFILFVNQLASFLNDTDGVNGIQLSPNEIEILLLMFADDLALMSDTVLGLQRQLNALGTFCSDFGLTVNTKKTKIMVFKRGGVLARHERWTFNHEPLETVKSFTYVGVTFTSCLSLNAMASNVAVKAKKALITCIVSTYQYGQLPYTVFFKIFDMKILPILMYGTELWGFSLRNCTECVLRYACKNICVLTNILQQQPYLVTVDVTHYI